MLWALLLAAGADVVATAAPSPAPAPAPAAAAIASEDGFRVGIDTFGTVTAKLGKPYFVQTNSTGTMVALYISTHMHVKATTFIPYVGLFAGGAKSKTSTKTFIFDSAGLLKSFSSSSMNTDCHTTVIGAACN